mmetsp:Transcript_85902/g.143048  ORF Transcript_85902/g.143048 Transcript_85902/m.143048 type:complete len:237 (-) Transcript_85902:904-1614(-)
MTAVVSHCIPSLHHHVVRDLRRPCNDGASPKPREDKRVVPLPNGHLLAIRRLHVVERATARNQRLVVGPLHDVLGERLNAGIGVRQRHDDGDVSVGGNCLHNLLRELPRDAAKANEACALGAHNRLQQVGNAAVWHKGLCQLRGLGAVQLVVLHPLAAMEQQSGGIQHHDTGPGLLRSKTLTDHPLAQHPGYTSSTCTGSRDDDHLVRQFLPCLLARRNNPSHRDCTGPLNIVVER